jgi:predicted NBD/HSP70 family sugar kinase
MPEKLRGNYNRLFEKLINSARDFDETANMVFDSLATHIAKAVGGIANILNPEMIVLGGPVAAASDIFSDKLCDEFSKYVIGEVGKSVELKTENFSYEDCSKGAASLALDSVFPDLVLQAVEAD